MCDFEFNNPQPTQATLDKFYKESAPMKLWSEIKSSPEEEKRQRELVFRLEKMLKEMSGATRNGHATECLPGILNVRIKGVDAALLARALNTKFGVCVHSAPRGSASLVLKAMGKTDTEATQSIRISLSRFSTEEQMKFFAGSIQPAIRLSQMKS